LYLEAHAVQIEAEVQAMQFEEHLVQILDDK
jgi:hypothetical protein